MVRVAGVVLMRQHPGSAKGVTFMTIEDETGSREHHRLGERGERAAARRFIESRLLEVQGELQNQQGVHARDRAHAHRPIVADRRAARALAGFPLTLLAVEVACAAVITGASACLIVVDPPMS